MEETKGFADKYFLEKIYLSGYKSIQQTEIELKSNLNIIIGKNGAGKTNFLEFLNKILNDDFDDIYEFESVLNFSGEKRIEIKAEKKIPKDAFEQKQFILNDGLSLSVIVDGEIDNYENSRRSFIRNLMSNNIVRSSTIIAHGIPKNYDFVTDSVTLTINEVEWLVTQLNNISFKKPYFISSLFYSFLFNEESNSNFLNNGMNIEKVKELLNNTLFVKVRDLNVYLKGLTPISNVRFNENFNIFTKKDEDELTITNLIIEFEVNGNWYPFSKLSDGTKRLFYIISEVAAADPYYFRYSDFGETNSNSRIILIEEPEIGIHPHQLHKLMIFLKEQSRTKQVIITTHSPEVLNILGADELDSIILSSYDRDKGTLLRHMTNKEKMDAKSYIKDMFLSDYWMHSNLEPAN